MDAVKFIREENRMCDNYRNFSDYTCVDCLCHSGNNRTNETCSRFRKNHPEEYVDIVAKWSAEHPAKTRQSEFLKMFPNASIRDVSLAICPSDVDKNVSCYGKKCIDCRKEYWLAEVE